MHFVFVFLGACLLTFFLKHVITALRTKSTSIWFASFDLDRDSRHRLHDLAVQHLGLKDAVPVDKMHITMRRDGVWSLCRQPSDVEYEDPIECVGGSLRVYPMRDGRHCLVLEILHLKGHRDRRLAAFGETADEDDQPHVTLCYNVSPDLDLDDAETVAAAHVRLHVIGESFAPWRYMPIKSRVQRLLQRIGRVLA